MPVDDISGGGVDASVGTNAGTITATNAGNNAGGEGEGVLAVTGRDTRGRQNAIWIKDVAVSARVRQAVLDMEAWRVQV